MVPTRILMVLAASLLSFPEDVLSSLNLGLGTNNCLLSRLPCQYRRPLTTKQPGANDMGDYHTRTNGRSCSILQRKHRVVPIPRTPSSDGSILYISSPGKLYQLPANYLNRKIVFYNMNCTSGQFIYFDIEDMNLENTKCFDQTVNKNKCIDFIQVRTPQGFIISDSCGTDKTNLDGVVLPFDSVQVIFRSSRLGRFPGFSATATCFNPVRCQASGRKKRAPTSTSSDLKCQASTHEKLVIPHGHDLVFQGTSVRTILSIVNRETNRIIARRTTLRPLQTFIIQSMNGSSKTYQYSQREYERIRLYTNYLRYPPIPNRLLGPGILHVPNVTTNGRACYQNYLVDVSEFIPSKPERVLINNFLGTLNGLIEREEPPTFATPTTPRPTTRSPKPPTRFPYSLQPIRYRRSAASLQLSYRKTNKISETTLLSALANHRACNPIVKVSASALVEAVEKDNPQRLLKLRRQR